MDFEQQNQPEFVAPNNTQTQQPLFQGPNNNQIRPQSAAQFSHATVEDNNSFNSKVNNNEFVFNAHHDNDFINSTNGVQNQEYNAYNEFVAPNNTQTQQPLFQGPNNNQIHPQSVAQFSHATVEDNDSFNSNVAVNNNEFFFNAPHGNDFINPNNGVQNQESNAYYEFENSFPPGYRFLPTDDELIVNYLIPKIDGRDVPESHIRNCNIYQHSPDEISELYPLIFGHKEWYFFSSRQRKYPNGKRPNRTAGDGFWKATGADSPIMVGSKEIGRRKALVFYRRKGQKRSLKTDWMMQEYCYTVSDPDSDSPKNGKRIRKEGDGMKLGNFVICKIYKKSKEGEGQNSNVNSPMDNEEGLNDLGNSSGLVMTNGENNGIPHNANFMCPGSGSLDQHHGHIVQHGSYAVGSRMTNPVGIPQGRINCAAQPDSVGGSGMTNYVGNLQGMINSAAQPGSLGPYEARELHEQPNNYGGMAIGMQNNFGGMQNPNWPMAPPNDPVLEFGSTSYGGGFLGPDNVLGSSSYGGGFLGSDNVHVNTSYRGGFLGSDNVHGNTSYRGGFLGSEEVLGTTSYGGGFLGSNDFLGITSYGNGLLGSNDFLGSTSYGNGLLGPDDFLGSTSYGDGFLGLDYVFGSTSSGGDFIGSDDVLNPNSEAINIVSSTTAHDPSLPKRV